MVRILALVTALILTVVITGLLLWFIVSPPWGLLRVIGFVGLPIFLTGIILGIKNVRQKNRERLLDKIPAKSITGGKQK